MGDVNEEVKDIQEDDSLDAALAGSDEIVKERRIYASNISKADILEMIAEVETAATALVQDLYDLDMGISFEKAAESMNRYAEILTNGKHRAFTRRNDWLDDQSYRKDFLSKETKDQSIEDRRSVVAFYDLSMYAKTLFDTFGKFAHYFTNEVVLEAYNIVRFRTTLYGSYTAEDYNRIKLALAEYDTIFRRYNNSSIYEEMDVSKDYTFEENYEAVLNHMDHALVTSNNLGAFLLNTKKPQMWEKNRLHCLDRETWRFKDLDDKAYRLQNAYDRAAEMEDQTATALTVYTGKTSQNFIGTMYDVLQKIMEIMKNRMEIMKQFRENTTEMPYALMHYDPVVVRVVNEYLAMSLENPLIGGTRYDDIAEAMLVRCRELAKTVAKSAAKWAPQ